MKLLSFLPALLLSFALCAPAMAQVVSIPPLSPVEAIQLAAAAAPDHEIQGTFLITVKATGDEKKPKKKIFLNSELDYRDQRNLTVAIEQSAISGLEARYGKDFKAYFVGKQILVSGAARRVTIIFGKPRVSPNGNLRNKYYFQTHVSVVDADQISLAPQTL
jgi:hypothetical protein